MKDGSCFSDHLNDEILSDDQAIFCFSHFFYNAEENENKVITHGICKRCGAPNIKIVGISEKGRRAEKVEEIICKNKYCGIFVISSRNHTKTIEKQPSYNDQPPMYIRERNYIKYR